MLQLLLQIFFLGPLIRLRLPLCLLQDIRILCREPFQQCSRGWIAAVVLQRKVLLWHWSMRTDVPAAAVTVGQTVAFLYWCFLTFYRLFFLLLSVSIRLHAFCFNMSRCCFAKRLVISPRRVLCKGNLEMTKLHFELHSILKVHELPVGADGGDFRGCTSRGFFLQTGKRAAFQVIRPLSNSN